MAAREKESKRILLLPVTQTQLCFDKNDFVKKDFCVDQFVAKCRQKVSLETLRENLEMYFKLLKNAMIELINKDYADFVNLSSNLVGMDKSIEILREPLNKINYIVEDTLNVMNSKVSELESALKEQNELKRRRKLLKHMKGLIDAVDKIEHIQQSDEFKTEQVSERIAGEFNQLQHHADFCKNLPVLIQIKPRITEITGSLQRGLERELVEGIIDGDAKKIHRCLNSYALIGKISNAEHLVRMHIINPQLQQIMLEQQGEVTIGKLKQLFTKILEFMSHNLRFICDITSGRKTKTGLQFRGILGYDFIVNSAWPAIVTSIENHLPELFASEDSDLYHKRYLQCMRFVESVERLCGSQASISRMRQSESFSNLMTHWSLPMYFQIRFQKIARTFVTSLMSPNDEAADASLGFRLNATCTLWICIETCWKDDVFISPLIHRFWKFTLQLIARYDTWLAQILPSDETGVDSGRTTTTTTPTTVDINNLSALVHDIDVLSGRVNGLFTNIIEGYSVKQGLKDTSMLKDALSKQLEKLLRKKAQIKSHVVQTLVDQSVGTLKQAQNVPRLFRKTNRAAPVEPSAYVASVVKPTVSYYSLQSVYMDDAVLSQWLSESTNEISTRFHSVVWDVLTSVRKMEESLMRLKKMRSGRASSGSLSTLGEGQLSDDDKIRLQLYIDVESFGIQMSSCGVDMRKVKKYEELLKLVEDARKPRSDNSS